MIDPSGIFYRNTKHQINSIISGVLQQMTVLNCNSCSTPEMRLTK